MPRQEVPNLMDIVGLELVLDNEVLEATASSRCNRLELWRGTVKALDGVDKARLFSAGQCTPSGMLAREILPLKGFNGVQSRGNEPFLADKRGAASADRGRIAS
jgi:hypothetical protein